MLCSLWIPAPLTVSTVISHVLIRQTTRLVAAMGRAFQRETRFGRSIVNDQPPQLSAPDFSGRWLAPLTYAFSGLFLLDGSDLTPERIHGGIRPRYEAVLTHRKKTWPRLLSKFHLVPVYCSTAFDRETIDALALGHRVGRRNPTRSCLGIRMKPMLCVSRS